MVPILRLRVAMPGQKKLGLLMGKSMVRLADGSQGLPEGSLTSPPAGSPNATRTQYYLWKLRRGFGRFEAI